VLVIEIKSVAIMRSHFSSIVLIRTGFNGTTPNGLTKPSAIAAHALQLQHVA
jgi:hypothetical protein